MQTEKAPLSLTPIIFLLTIQNECGPCKKSEEAQKGRGVKFKTNPFVKDKLGEQFQVKVCGESTVQATSGCGFLLGQ